MKNLINYITESTNADELQEEVGIALRKFGNIRNGFKYTDKQSIVEAMSQIGFEYDDESNDDEKQMTFIGEYLNSEYEVDLYIANQTGDRVKLRNFNVFEN